MDEEIQKEEEIKTENIEDLKNKCEEYLNNWHTERANLLNYQQNERSRFESFSNFQEMSFLTELINIMDTFDLSFNSIGECEDNPKLKQTKEGFYLVYSQMENLLKKYHVTKIESLNTQFDPNIHETVESLEDKEKPDGLIIEEFQKGYKYKDLVLRPSKVKIIKNN